MILLAGCAKESSNLSIVAPPFPQAGAAVADELETLPEDQYPALYDWLGHVAIYAEQMEVSQ